MGKGEHPLADGLMRKNVIDQMRGGLDHAARTARGAKAPAFAGERDQVLMLAPIALDAQEPVLKQAALEVVVELPLDEMRQGCAFGLQPGKKLRIAGLDDAIERRLFRSVAFVDVAVGAAGSKQSSQPASAWVDKAGRRRTTCLSASSAI